jgi:hypothetical protein
MSAKVHLRFLPIVALVLGFALNASSQAAPDDCDTACREKKIILRLTKDCLVFSEPICNFCTSQGVSLGGCRSGDPVLPGVCSAQVDAKGDPIYVKSTTFPTCKAKCFVENDQKYVQADGTAPDPLVENGIRLKKCKGVAD